jgi:hypothetical protein
LPCGSYSYVLTNGQVADANQVMANFNLVLNCANTLLAPLASPTLTGTPIAPTATAGDVSNQIATDLFAATAATNAAAAHGLQSSGALNISSSTVLGASQLGHNIVVSGTSAVTLTFPVSLGTYWISNENTQNVTFVFPMTTDFRTTLYPGEQVGLSGDGNGTWRIIAAGVPLYGAGAAAVVVTTDQRFGGPIQVSWSNAYTFVISDAGDQYYHPSADTTARTWTIPANSSVAFLVSTKIEIVNDCSAGALTIAINSDTLEWFPTGTTGSRTLAACGIATLTKITSTEWAITGVGLS